MRRVLIVANWKLHLTPDQSATLIDRLDRLIRTNRQVEIVIAPTMLSLHYLSQQIDKRKFKLAAQNAYHQDEGAYTGEVSFSMLKGLVKYAIIGHSDRRYKFNETLDTIRDKVAASMRHKIVPIICVGETQTEKSAAETNQVLHDQVTTAVADLVASEVEQIVIAYEPVWALSDGHNFRNVQTPTPTQLVNAAKTIRTAIRTLYGAEAAKGIRLLYGGSTHAATAADFLGAKGVDGLLVGGASLNQHEFSGIIKAAAKVIAQK